MTELTQLRTENGKMFDAGKDAKTGRPSYTLEARTGPIHYKEAYADREPWLDLDESYSEPGELKGIGRVLVYPRLPNIVTVFQDICGYQIQSRSNPDHIAKVELVSIDGQEVTAWQDRAALRTIVRVHPYRVGIWKDFSAASKPKSTTMRWKVTELGNADKDSHPFAFRESPEAFSTADLTGLDPDSMEQAKVTIETARTRIDDNAWYWDELIPAEAKLVDTDWKVGADADDGFVDTNSSTFYTMYGSNLLYIAGLYYNLFARFTNVTITRSATITSTVLSITSSGNKSTAETNVLYCFADADNPSAPTTFNEFTGISRTSGVEHNNLPTWSTGTTYQSSQLNTDFQTVVNRAGFSSGNAIIAFIMDNDSGSASAYRSTYSYSKGSTYAIKISITWTEPTTLPVFYYHYNNMRP